MPKAKKPQRPEGELSINGQNRLKAKDPVYVQQQLAIFEAMSDADRAKFLQANFYLRTPFTKAGVDLNFYLGGNFPLG